MMMGAGATGAVAQRLITGKDIADGSVTGRDVGDKSLRLKDLAPEAKKKLRGATGPAGPVGPAGMSGPQGMQGERGPADAFHAYGSGDVPLWTEIRPNAQTVLATHEVPPGSYLALATVAARQRPAGTAGDVHCSIRVSGAWDTEVTGGGAQLVLDDHARDTLVIQAAFTLTDNGGQPVLNCGGEDVTVSDRTLIVIRTGSLHSLTWR